MKKTSIQLILLLFVIVFTTNTHAQNPENWTSDQLIQPADLAKTLESGKDIPVILNVGPAAQIPHSVKIGMVKDKDKLDKLKSELKSIAKDKKIVVYCGCCPFANCPNVRPAIKMLTDMKFTNFFLLNIPKNIKTDWIDKGYPVVE